MCAGGLRERGEFGAVAQEGDRVGAAEVLYPFLDFWVLPTQLFLSVGAALMMDM